MIPHRKKIYEKAIKMCVYLFEFHDVSFPFSYYFIEFIIPKGVRIIIDTMYVCVSPPCAFLNLWPMCKCVFFIGNYSNDDSHYKTEQIHSISRINDSITSRLSNSRQNNPYI